MKTKSDQAGKNILFSLKIGGKKLGRFIATLRDFGMMVRDEMNETNGTSNKQFVVACLASPEEIKDENLTMIENSETIFLTMPRPIDLSKRYFTTGRIAVIMNLLYWHGEARLLDPTGEIWRSVTGIEDTEEIEKRSSFIDMQENMETYVGSHNRPVLIVYSHLIPCTDPGHECAKLIAKYAERNNDIKIIVYYDVTYKDTNTKEAIEPITKCSNIYMCLTSEFRPYMNHEVYQKKQEFDEEKRNKIKSVKWRTAEHLSHYEEKSFRKFSRINRRHTFKGSRKAERDFEGRV